MTPVRAVLLYAGVLVIAVGLGFAVRDWSLDRVTTVLEERRAIVSPARLEPELVRTIVELADQSSEVRSRVGAADSSDRPLILYVLPESWHLADIPAEPLPPGSHGHDTPSDFDPNRFKVLYTRARTHTPDSRGREILLRAYGREPLALAFVDLANEEIEEVREPVPHVLWGDIPTPLF